MAFKDKIKIPEVAFKTPRFTPPKPSTLLYWRLALAGVILLCLVLAGVIWMSGDSETHDAFQDGRRLLIRLDNGDIEGKVASTAPAAAAAQPAPKPEAQPKQSVDTALYPETTAPVTLPAPLGKLDTGPIAAASVPLKPPSDALSEKTADGALPTIGSDGAKPWLYYAKSYDRTGSLPMIAIIVTGLGESKAASEGALRLPENFSLSFSPYARGINDWIKSARAAGHEVFLDLPLEPANYPASDPGPYGLLLSKSQKENDAHLRWLMTRAQSYVGFVTPQNQNYSSNDTYFQALLTTLSARGLMLVVGHEPAQDKTRQMLEDGHTPTITADTLIDEDLSPTAIQARLATLEQIAKTRGYAVGIAQAYPVTIQQLKNWAATLTSQGFVLAPVTFIVHLRFS